MASSICHVIAIAHDIMILDDTIGKNNLSERNSVKPFVDTKSCSMRCAALSGSPCRETGIGMSYRIHFFSVMRSDTFRTLAAVFSVNDAVIPLHIPVE